VNLLDTHVLIWALSAPAKLSPAARRIVEDGELAVSAACLWEMALKQGRKSEIVPDPMAWWERHVRKAGVPIVPIQDVHIMHLDTLPPHHTDPFDRILVCQCIHEGMRLVTRDQSLRDHYQAYVHMVW
jgi:PIN domain nuclease of toxin-antitoxin system